MSADRNRHSFMSDPNAIEAMFGRYEVIYQISIETDSYKGILKSDDKNDFWIGQTGPDFFRAFPQRAAKCIFKDDRERILFYLEKETLLENMKKDNYFSVLFRTHTKTGVEYRLIRAARIEMREKQYVVLEIREVDEMIQREMQHLREHEMMLAKESTHMTALMDRAVSYAEANLTENKLLSRYLDKEKVASNDVSFDYPPEYENTFNEFYAWFADNYVVGNEKQYREINNADHLIKCYNNGMNRISLSFTIRDDYGGEQLINKIMFLYQVKSKDDVYAFCVTYDSTQKMNMERENEELRKTLTLNRVQELTSQMQPHFLYNALGSIQQLILKDPEYAYSMLDDFTLYLRSCVRALSKGDPISFEEELRNIEAYTNIEKMRFGDKLKIRYEIRPKHFKVLPLSIQPIVENAIRHGIYQRGEKGGTVLIRTGETPKEFVIEIADDGIGFDVEKYEAELQKGKDSSGLSNIGFRLEKVIGAKVEVRSRIGEGTKVKIIIPKEIS